MGARPLSDSRTQLDNCDLCGSRSARQLYTATDRLRNTDASFSIARCDGCGVLRTLPVMSDSDLSAYYPKTYWGERKPPSLAWICSSQSEKTEFLRTCSLSRGQILDVGCGAGLFLRALDGQAWERYGVETGSEASRLAADELGAAHIFNCSLVEAQLGTGEFDVVTMWSALEHMNHPRSNLFEARRLVRPGGTIIVQVPNAASYQARMFKGKWFALDAPRHRYHFSQDVLNRLLSDAGFQIYKTTCLSRAHNAHAFRQSLKTTLRAGESHAGFALFCLAIPLIRPIDLVLTALGSGATLTVAARAL
jgi:2-polyprenyl-3-methyl-5-hydroxy-6-metoxy-1,4-benzoquinol methylase